MRKLLLALFVCMMTLVGCINYSPTSRVYTAPTKEEKPFYRKAGPILRIKASVRQEHSILSSYGTAFVTKYKDQKIIVTALHVIVGADVFNFYTEDKKFVDVVVTRIVAIPNLDAAIFFVDYISAFITPLEVDDVYLGDSLKTVGFPLDGDKVEFKGKPTTFIMGITATVEYGMSGGPILKNGKVVGVISTKVISSSDGAKGTGSRLSDIFAALQYGKK